MEGNKVYRHEQNPEEKRFHDEFIRIHGHDNTLSAIVFAPAEGGLRPSEYLTEREEKILLSAMQWLGSPLGQSFLREMGYEKKPEKFMTDNNRSYVAKRCRNTTGWKYRGEVFQDKIIEMECKRIGFTKEEFFAADGKFLNKILKK